MPALMKMTLSNGHPPQQPFISKPPTLAAVPKKMAPEGLNRSMIARIHNAKPGCGSCGRGR
jgi:hypothetical protein